MKWIQRVDANQK